MSQVTGIVEQIRENQTASGTAYNVRVSGEWYGAGFQAPQFQEGQTIAFDWQQKGRFKQLYPKSVQVVQAQPQQQPAPQQQSSAPTSKGRDWGANQLAIQYQSARNAAIHLVEVLLANNALPVPAKKADQMDAVVAAVDDLTNQFHTKCDKVVKNGGVFDEELEQRLGTPDDFEQ